MRADAGIWARLPTMVMPVLRRSGSSTLGVSKSLPVPTMALGPTLTSLSRMARSTTAPARMCVSNMMTLSRTMAPGSTRTPGESTECSTVPEIWQPWLMRLRCTLAVLPMRAGARSSERV